MVGEWLVNGWQLLGEWLANGWKMVGQWLVNGWQIFGEWLANGWPMVGRLLANGWPMAGQWLANGTHCESRVYWELLFNKTANNHQWTVSSWQYNMMSCGDNRHNLQRHRSHVMQK